MSLTALRPPSSPSKFKVPFRVKPLCNSHDCSQIRRVCLDGYIRAMHALLCTVSSKLHTLHSTGWNGAVAATLGSTYLFLDRTSLLHCSHSLTAHETHSCSCPMSWFPSQSTTVVTEKQAKYAGPSQALPVAPCDGRSKHLVHVSPAECLKHD
mmetsp:Transcript_43065/g.77370  ORF Transcript_43065/g.77370 Transcript_43065/m.77370 type:complete len:153 (-) Transcript_43065:750-1208(-)